MSNAIGVDACANFLRDYIDEIILKILGDARDQSHANRRTEQQAYTSNELRARILAIACRVGVDDVPENERIQQRKNLIDRRQDKSDDSKPPQILKVPVESSHLSVAAVPRTTFDDLSREPLLYRRFQAQDTAATCARYHSQTARGFGNRPKHPCPLSLCERVFEISLPAAFTAALLNNQPMGFIARQCRCTMRSCMASDRASGFAW